MNEREIDDILSRHADRLLASEPGAAVRSPEAFVGLPPARLAMMAGLTKLAERVRAALVAVEPRPAFVLAEKQQLVKAWRAPTAGVAPAERGEQRLIWMAGLGGAAYLASLGVVSLLAARAGRGWIRSARAGRPVLERAQPAP